MNLLDLYFESKEFSNEKNKNDYRVVIKKLLEVFGDNLENMDSNSLLDFIGGDFSKYEKTVNKKTIEKTYAVKTYEKNISIIKSFLNAIYELKLIDVDYANYIKATPQKRAVLFDQLPTAEHIKAIQKYLYEQPIYEDYYALRDLVIFNLIFHSGISSKDLAALSVSDIGHQGNDYAVLLEDKDKIVIINTHDAKLLSHLLILRKKEQTKDDAIFISQKLKTRITRRAIGYIINGLCSNVEVLKNTRENYMPIFSAEKFKKAGITAALSIGYSKEKMREELNVSSEFFNRRFKYVDHPEVTRTYADLFKN